MDRLKKVFNLSAAHQKTSIAIKIREAISDGNLKNLKKLAKQNSSRRDTFNRIALLDACAHGNDEVLQFLVEAKADLNVWDKQHQSALMKAVQAQSERCVSILLDNHADTKLVDIDGNTALHFAASNLSISIAQRLVENMADVNTANKVRDTPLSLAVTNNNCEMVRFLVTEGADVNFKGQHQRSPLMVAAFYGFYEMCGLLLELGADVTLTDEKGWPATLYSDMNKHNSCSWLIGTYCKPKTAAPAPAPKLQEPEAAAVNEELLGSCGAEESVFGQLDADTDEPAADEKEQAQPDQEPSVSAVQENQTNDSSELVQLLQRLSADDKEDETQDWSNWDCSSILSANSERGEADESVELELPITPDFGNMVMLQNIEPDDECCIENESCHPADQEEFQAEVTDFKFPLEEEEERFCLTAMKGDVTRDEELWKAEEQQQSKIEEHHSDAQRLLAEEHNAETLQENQLQSQLAQPQEAEDDSMLDVSESSEASSELDETCDREKELLQLSPSLLKEELEILKADFESSQASSCFRERCLVEENKALKRQLETTEAELEQERQAHKELEPYRTRLPEVLQEVEEFMSVQAGREESLLRKLDEYQRVIEALTAEAASQREAVSSLSQKLTGAESHTASMEKELHSVTLQLSQKDLLLEVLQRDKDQAAASVQELEEALQAERERVSHAAARQEAAEEQLAKAQSEARLLHKQLEEAESNPREGQKIAELQFELEKEVSRCTHLQNENKELQHQLASLNGLSQRTEQLEIRHRKLEEEVLFLKDQVEASEKEKSELAQYCRDVKEKARRKIQQKQAHIDLLQSEAVSQQGLIADHSASVQKLHLQLDQKVRELEDLQVWAYNNQQDLLKQKNSAYAEMQRLRQLHSEEEKCSRATAAKLQRTSILLNEVATRIINQYTPAFTEDSTS